MLKKAKQARKNPIRRRRAPHQLTDTLISDHVLAIVYRHAADGQLYVHQFGGSEAVIHHGRQGDTLSLGDLPERTDVLMEARGRDVILHHLGGEPLSQGGY